MFSNVSIFIMAKKQSAQQTILSALENLTVTVGKLAEKVQTLEASKGSAALEQLETITGKLPEEEKVEQSVEEKLNHVRAMEEVFGTKKVNPYGTTEPAIFEEKLKSMTYADLQNLAHEVGVPANYQPPQLRKALKNSFIQASKSFGGSFRPKPTPVDSRLDPKNPKHLKLMRMLGMATQ